MSYRFAFLGLFSYVTDGMLSVETATLSKLFSWEV